MWYIVAVITSILAGLAIRYYRKWYVLTQENRELIRRVVDLTSSVGICEYLANNHVSMIEDLFRQRSEYGKKIRACNDTIKAVEADLLKAHAELEANQSRINSLMVNMDSLSIRDKDRVERIAELRSQVRLLTTRINAMTSRDIERCRTISELKNELQKRDKKE